MSSCTELLAFGFFCNTDGGSSLPGMKPPLCYALSRPSSLSGFIFPNNRGAFQPLNLVVTGSFGTGRIWVCTQSMHCKPSLGIVNFASLGLLQLAILFCNLVRFMVQDDGGACRCFLLLSGTLLSGTLRSVPLRSSSTLLRPWTDWTSLLDHTPKHC